MSSEHKEGDEGKGEGHDEHLVGVSISTTAGFYPPEGFDHVPITQKVEVQLHKAQQHLGIKDTSAWIATVILPTGKKQIDVTKTYRENGLSGKVEIDWGPSEGGGG